ncbi:MAG: hypothetical protein PVF15_00740 [Candidatus Bathyarchaeota archaeon]|jgi:hypothetical protein
MSLPATFEVTPRKPFVSLYDSVKAVWKYVAFLDCYGVIYAYWSPRSLTSQYGKNEAFLIGSRSIGTPAPATMPSPYYHYSVARLMFRTDGTADDQYLLMFHLSSRSAGRAAIYVNGVLANREDVTRLDEKTSILMPCPGPQRYSYIYLFRETGLYNELSLKGIECYLLRA